MMNCVLSKLKSLFDNFGHISIWPNSLQKHMNKALQYLKCQILLPGLHIRKSQISDCCSPVDLPLESTTVNGLFWKNMLYLPSPFLYFEMCTL